MISDTLFARWMDAFAKRLGAPIDDAVLFAHHAVLSAELDDETFAVACQRLYRDFDGFRFKALPTPADFVTAVRPKATPETDGLEAFDAILWSRTRTTTAEQRGGPALRAYRAVGGWDAFHGCTDDALPHLRRRYVQAYCEVSESLAHADGLALATGDDSPLAIRAMVAAIGKPMPTARPRLVRGDQGAA